MTAHRPYSAVVFDLDGTLLDTLRDLADSMNAVLAAEGLPIHPVHAYRHFVGDGVEKLVRRTLPGNQQDDAYVRKLMTAMRQEYAKRWLDHSRPYDGIEQMLAALHAQGLKLAILSNKPHQATLSLVEKLLPSSVFELVLGARDHVPQKPDPAGALEIVDRFRIPSNKFLYLGDTNTDMRTATDAGMYPVGVLWGFRDADELTANGARTLIEHPVELLDLAGKTAN